MSDKVTKQRNFALIAIITAIVIALVLVGLGYLAFVSSDIETSIVPEQDIELAGPVFEDEALPDNNQPVDVEELDKRIDELDKEFDENNQGENFSNDGLSDESLGI